MSDPRFRLTKGDEQETRQAFQEVPRVSFFSTSNGPNASGVSAAQGTLGIDVSESAETVAWVARRSGSNWSGLEIGKGYDTQTALSSEDTSTVDGAYDAGDEGSVISRNRTRIAEIEDSLRSVDILP